MPRDNFRDFREPFPVERCITVRRQGDQRRQDMSDDVSTISRVLAGDAGAFRELVVRHERRVYGFAWQLLRDAGEAEDVAQEVFVAAYRKLGEFEAGRAQFSTWLLALTRNRCCNVLRGRERRERIERQVSRPLPAPEAAAADGEVWQELDRALERLPLEQRTAFVLAELQDLPYAEIAAIEGVEIGTVKSRVSRARERLREALQDWQPACAKREST